MNKEIKKKFVEALRSGEYEQGGLCLHKDNQFCCLGVLIDLYAKEHGLQSEWKQFSDKVIGNVFSFLDEKTMLPLLVIEWAGLPNYQKVIIDGKEETLIHHNDAGKTFLQIADAVEEQL